MLIYNLTIFNLIFDHFLAFGDELLGSTDVLGVGKLIDEAVALVLGIAVTVKTAVLSTILSQLEFALHDEQGEILADGAERIGLQRILGGDDAGRIVALIVLVDIAEIATEVIVEFGREKLLHDEFVL